MLTLFSSLIVVFFFIFLGWLGVKINLFRKAEARTFNNFVYYFTFPALLFSALYKTDWHLFANRNFLLVNTLVALLGFLLAYFWGVLRHYPAKKRLMVAIAAVLGNTAYLGIPLNTLLFGQEGLIFASLVASWQVLLLLVLALYLFNRQQVSRRHSFLISLKDTLKTPLIVAVVLGLLASYFHLSLPAVVSKIIETLGQATLATALLALGIFLYAQKWRSGLSLSLGLSFYTLVLLPALALFLIWLWPLIPDARAVTVIQAAAPLAVLNFTLAQKFQAEEEAVAKATLVSTVLSFFSYIFWIALVGRI